jgi:predicted RNA binding protein YcfA (HicA-like mRNA interferase family)
MARSFTSAVKAILRDNGCSYVRQAKGDHELWESPINGRRFIVDSNIKSRHLANEIMKQAGIKHHF